MEAEMSNNEQTTIPEVGQKYIKDNNKNGYVMVSQVDDKLVYGHFYMFLRTSGSVKIDQTEKFWIRNMHTWDLYREHLFSLK